MENADLPVTGVPALPDAPPAPRRRQPAVNSVLGATSGPYEGNVRAVLAVMAMLFLHLAWSALLWACTHGSADMKPQLDTLSGLLFAADVAAVTWYFAKRSAETGG